jgi:hypothetical protein
MVGPLGEGLAKPTFCSRSLKSDYSALGYSRGLLFGQRCEHRNHGIFEWSSRVEPLLLIGNIPDAFRLKSLKVVERGSRPFSRQSI